MEGRSRTLGWAEEALEVEGGGVTDLDVLVIADGGVVNIWVAKMVEDRL
jgi:hypothetical protein